jgi:N-acetylglucosaminylphosphatidylinositol deacetylase
MKRTQDNTVYCVVIAHPDDESMFFVPTIHQLVSAGETVWILCLTTGDHDGLGQIRVKELHEAAALLGVSKVLFLPQKDPNVPVLHDHPINSWNVQEAVKAIRTKLEDTLKEIPMVRYVHLLTFDHGGVSGHINHRDTYFAVRQLLAEHSFAQQAATCQQAVNQLLRKHSSVDSIPSSSSPRSDYLSKYSLTGWSLETVHNPITKYLPVVEWLYLLLSIVLRFRVKQVVLTKNDCWIFRCHMPALNWRAMATHQSQFVWYRRLFVVFSCYTYANRLRRMTGTMENNKRGRAV